MDKCKKLRKEKCFDNVFEFLKTIGFPNAGDEVMSCLVQLKDEYDFVFFKDGRILCKPINTKEKRLRKKESKRRIKDQKELDEYNKKIQEGLIIKRKYKDIIINEQEKYQKANVGCLILDLLINEFYKDENNNSYLRITFKSIMKNIFDCMPFMRIELEDSEPNDTKEYAFYRLKKNMYQHLRRIVLVCLKDLEDQVRQEYFEEYTPYQLFTNKDLSDAFYNKVDEVLKEYDYDEIRYRTLEISFPSFSSCYEYLHTWMGRGNNRLSLKVNLYEMIKYHFIRYAKCVEIRSKDRNSIFKTQDCEKIRSEMIQFVKDGATYKSGKKRIDSLDEIDISDEFFTFNLAEKFREISCRIISEQQIEQ